MFLVYTFSSKKTSPMLKNRPFGDFSNLVYLIIFNFFFEISCSISKVAFTERLSVFLKITPSPYFSVKGLKNSSPQEGENVNTPSKSISIFSPLFLSFKAGWKAKNASLPIWRDVRVVPNFFIFIIIVKKRLRQDSRENCLPYLLFSNQGFCRLFATWHLRFGKANLYCFQR